MPELQLQLDGKHSPQEPTHPHGSTCSNGGVSDQALVKPCVSEALHVNVCLKPCKSMCVFEALHVNVCLKSCMSMCV